MTGNDGRFPETMTGQHAGAELLPGTVLAGRFEIVRMLGIGGMGVVYLARDRDLDVPVAIKLLRPELASRPEAFERFRQELLLARQVSSPHVVRIHDIAQHDGRWLISMDLIEGQSLEKMIDQRGPLPVEEALGLLRQIAEGLEAAHRGGVVHRDLKPANILVDRSGHACISDFGVARSLGASGMTRSGAVVGTPDYLSPEQARAEPADQRSDLYSLGLIGYEMLTGKLPFAGGTPAESALQRITRAPPPVTQLRADVPAWVAGLLARLLQPSPSHRLQTARALVEAIDTRGARPGARRRWRVLAVAALALAVAAAGLVAWRQTGIVPRAAVPARIAVMSVASAPVVSARDDAGTGGSGTDAAPAEGSDANVLRGLSEHLRLWIGERQMAVVDMERTAQALALLGDQSTSGAPAPEQLHETIGARTVVGTRWVEESGDRGHVAFDVYRSEQPTVTVRGSTQTAAAIAGSYRDGALMVLSELGLKAGDPPVDLPEQRRALASFGQGLRERASGDPAAAVQRFNETTVAAPGFTPAWLALAESARAAGRGDAALTAALNGLRLVDSPDSAQAMRLEALRASLEGDPDRAAATLGQLAALRPGDTQAALLLAEAQSEAGRFQDAAERLQEMAAIDADDPRVWFLLGKVSILRGEARRAVDDYLVRALVLFNRSRNAAGQADTINALGVGYDRLGQVDQAIEQYRRAVELRRTLGDPRGLASSLRNLAALAAVRGEFDLAGTHLAEARTLLEDLRDRQGLADLDNDLGLLAEERGDFATALEHYRTALQQRQSIGHAHGVAESLNNVGFSQYQLGAYDDALVYWRQALDSFQALGDLSGVVRSRQNLAVLDIARGNWDEARAGLGATLVQAEREQMVEEAAVSLRYLAELSLLRGDSEDARRSLDRAERLFVGRDDQRGLLDVALLRVRAAMLDQRAARERSGTDMERTAEAWLEPLLDRLDTLSVAQRVEVLLVAADAALRAGNQDSAAHALRRLDALVTQAGVPLHALHARVLSAALPGAGGRADEALVAAERLSNVPLLLRAQEIALAQALASPSAVPAAALAHYRDAMGLLRRVGTYAYAQELHRLGALAADQAGDADAAREARAAQASPGVRP